MNVQVIATELRQVLRQQALPPLVTAIYTTSSRYRRRQFLRHVPALQLPDFDFVSVYMSLSPYVLRHKLQKTAKEE